MRFVLFIKENKLKLGVGKPADINQTAFRLTTESGREEKISQKSILYETELKSTSNVTQQLAQIRSSAQELAKEIETKLIWELLAGQSRTLPEIAVEWFGKKTLQPEEVLAIALALTADTIRFKLIDNKILALDEKTVKESIARAQKEKEFEEKVESATNYLLSLLNGKFAEHPDSENILDWVERAAKDEVISDKVAQATFERIKSRLNPYRSSLITILKTAGRKPNIPSMILARFNVAREFSKEAIEQAKKLSSTLCDYSNRRELNDLFTFSIDNEYTRDFDDALSIKVNNDDIEVWMHIADSSVIEHDSALDKEAYERIATVYLPDGKIPMLPVTLSEDYLSLKAGEKRRAISHYFKFNKDGTITDFDIFLSVINVEKNLSYETASKLMLEQQSEVGLGLTALYQLREKLLNARIQRGAKPFYRREVKLWVDKDGRVWIKEIERSSPSMQIIEEFSILTNAFVANFCRERKIPALYRFSTPSGVTLSFEPTFHSGLGLDAYVQVTSPIRRYTDMLMQRQIASWFTTKKPLYEEDVNFLMRAKDAERKFAELKLATEQIEHYWKLVYLQQNADLLYTIVLPKSRIAYVYELLLPVYQPLPPWMTVRTAAKARVKSVDPDTMRVEFDILEQCSLPWEAEEELRQDEANG